MYIVAIGWIYVALMMAITEHTVVAGIATFLLYGVAPVALLLYIMGTPGRRRRRKAAEQRDNASGDVPPPDAGAAQSAAAPAATALPSAETTAAPTDPASAARER